LHTVFRLVPKLGILNTLINGVMAITLRYYAKCVTLHYATSELFRVA